MNPRKKKINLLNLKKKKINLLNLKKKKNTPRLINWIWISELYPEHLRKIKIFINQLLNLGKRCLSGQRTEFGEGQNFA